jgi:hypothetical protein
MIVMAYIHYTHYVRGVIQAAAGGNHNDHAERIRERSI